MTLLVNLLAIDEVISMSNPLLINVTITRNSFSPGNNRFFVPPEITVFTGSIINWFNNDTNVHTVTSGTPLEGPTGEFNSGLIEPGGIYVYSPGTKGEINYYCTPHPWMRGKIVIRD